jgi:hypothetical protein
MVPLLAAARRRGDETLVVGPAALQEAVAATGHDFWAGGAPAEEAIAPIREQLPVAPPAEASVLGNRELFGRLATRALLPDMRRAWAAWRPDLVLREPCEYAAAVVALEQGRPIATVAISLADVEAGSIDVAGPALEEHRTGLTAALRAWPYLTRFPASVDPSPFADTRRFAERPPPAEPLPDWWGGTPGPLVYLTLGTVLGHMSMAADAYRTVLAGMDGLAARVLLTVGRQFDPAALGPVPAHVHVERWVDQARILPHADLVVCHGGSGTTFGALAAGVPLVVVSHFADQFENGRRVVAAGAGRAVAADPTEIAAAVADVLARGSYRDRAKAVAAEMAAAPSAGAVLEDLLGREPAGRRS